MKINKDNCTIINDGNFSWGYIKVNYPDLKNTDFVILCLKNKNGHEKFYRITTVPPGNSVLLPHQIYLKDIEKLIKDNPGYEVWVLPTGEGIQIATPD